MRRRELRGLLATSGAAAIILAFATQNLLGGVIAGMSLQINKPYKVGDWLQVGEHFAEVMEINWRSTRLRTNDAIYLDIPNNEIVRQTIVNLHYPTQSARHAHSGRASITDVPPNRVKDALLRATIEREERGAGTAGRRFSWSISPISPSPTRSSSTWAIMPDSTRSATRSAPMSGTNSSGRRSPSRSRFAPSRSTRKRAVQPHEEHDRARAILEGEPLFHCLASEQLDVSFADRARFVSAAAKE